MKASYFTNDPDAVESARRTNMGLAAVALERARQDHKWGRLRDFPDGTGGGGRETYEKIAKLSCDRAEREGRMTWAHIFEEEASEVLAQTDVGRLREELVQVAAVAVAWIEALDNREREE